MKCTVGWCSPEFDYTADLKDQSDEVIAERLANDGYERGCQNEADYEVCQNHMGKDKDGKAIKLETTYHIGFNCEQHVPKKTAQNYVIEEIK